MVKQKKGCFNIGSGEKKIIIVLLYYVLLVEFSLLAFTLSTSRISQFRTSVQINFFCESRGFNPDAPCDRSQLDSYKFPEVNLIAYMLLELFPVINFTYVIKFRTLKKWVCIHILRREEERSSNEYYSTATRSYRSASYSVNSSANARIEFSKNRAVSLPETKLYKEHA